MLRLCIPTIKRFDLLEKEIISANSGTIVPDKITVLDNSGGSCPKFENYPNVEVIVADKNLGVAGSWNYFMQNYPDDINIIANDDIEFFSSTFENMQTIFLSYSDREDVGLVYPMDENGSSMNAFSCFIMKHETFKKIGPFDENFFPAYFEDNDYYHRMILAGVYMHAVPDCKYAHVGSATIKSYTSAEQAQHHKNFEKNKNYYIQKWGGPPGHETR